MLKQPRTKKSKKSRKPVEATLSRPIQIVLPWLKPMFQKKMKLMCEENLQKIMKILDKIDDVKGRGVI